MVASGTCRHSLETCQAAAEEEAAEEAAAAVEVVAAAKAEAEEAAAAAAAAEVVAAFLALAACSATSGPGVALARTHMHLNATNDVQIIRWTAMPSAKCPRAHTQSRVVVCVASTASRVVHMEPALRSILNQVVGMPALTRKYGRRTQMTHACARTRSPALSRPPTHTPTHPHTQAHARTRITESSTLPLVPLCFLSTLHHLPLCFLSTPPSPSNPLCFRFTLPLCFRLFLSRLLLLPFLSLFRSTTFSLLSHVYLSLSTFPPLLAPCLSFTPFLSPSPPLPPCISK